MVFNIVQVVRRTFAQTITLHTKSRIFPNFCYIENIEIWTVYKFRTLLSLYFMLHTGVFI